MNILHTHLLYRMMWNEVNCSQRNGLITGYTVMISNSSITYKLNSTEKYIVFNDLVFRAVYNISVATVNSVGRGPFSDPMAIEIGIGMQLLYYISSVRKCFYSVPGLVDSVSSIMDTTWAVISWSAPSYIPSDYPIISFELGYYAPSQFHNCLELMVETDSLTSKFIDVSNTANITGLTDNTCYIFGVRAGTVNGYGGWTFIANETLKLPPPPSLAVLVTPSLLCKYYCLLIYSPKCYLKSLSMYHFMLMQ